jgi:hypothetical protein
MLDPPIRTEWNASREPSGDHTGAMSSIESNVTRDIRSPRAGSMIQIALFSLVPLGSETAMCRSSGATASPR